MTVSDPPELTAVSPQANGELVKQGHPLKLTYQVTGKPTMSLSINGKPVDPSKIKVFIYCIYKFIYV